MLYSPTLILAHLQYSQIWHLWHCMLVWRRPPQTNCMPTWQEDISLPLLRHILLPESSACYPLGCPVLETTEFASLSVLKFLIAFTKNGNDYRDECNPVSHLTSRRQQITRRINHEKPTCNHVMNDRIRHWKQLLEEAWLTMHWATASVVWRCFNILPCHFMYK